MMLTIFRIALNISIFSFPPLTFLKSKFFNELMVPPDTLGEIPNFIWLT